MSRQVQELPADLKRLSNTRGNHGHNMGVGALDGNTMRKECHWYPTFCEVFNEIAFEALQEKNDKNSNDDKIQILDG